MSYDWHGLNKHFPLHFFDHTTKKRSIVMSPAHLLKTLELDWASDRAADAAEYTVTNWAGAPMQIRIGNQVIEELSFQPEPRKLMFLDWMGEYEYTLLPYAPSVENWRVWA